MTTRLDVNALAGRAFRDALRKYPAIRAPLLRSAISNAKQQGTLAAQKALRGMLRELYMDAHGGSDPVGRHDFVHWMRDEALREDPTDPIQGIGPRDAFQADPENII